MRSVRHIRIHIHILALVSVLALAGCSLPFRRSAPPPIVPQTGSELQFTTYTHPTWGYTIDTLQGASISDSRDGRTTTIAYGDDTLVRGSYTTQVEVVPEVGAVTPDQMLQQAIQPVISSPPAPSPISTGTLPGAQVNYSTAKGDVCQDRNALMAAFVVNGTGYLVRVTSDALNRCNTDELPETQRVIGSFQPPAQ